MGRGTPNKHKLAFLLKLVLTGLGLVMVRIHFLVSLRVVDQPLGWT